MCELSCRWAPCLLLSVQLSFRQLQALKRDLAGTYAVQKGKKIHTLPCRVLLVKQVTAHLLSHRSWLLLDAHNKSAAVWRAAQCCSLTMPRIWSDAASQNSPSWNHCVYIANLQHSSSDSNRLKRSVSLPNCCASTKHPQLEFVPCLIKHTQYLKTRDLHYLWDLHEWCDLKIRGKAAILIAGN